MSWFLENLIRQHMDTSWRGYGTAVANRPELYAVTELRRSDPDSPMIAAYEAWDGTPQHPRIPGDPGAMADALEARQWETSKKAQWEH